MPAVNTVRFQYTPWTFDELLRMPLMYTQAFKEAEAKIEDLGMKAGTIQPDDNSPLSKELKSKYESASKEATDALAGGVYNKSVFNLTKAAVNSYRDNILPVAVAQDKLNRFRQTAMQAGIPIHKNVSLDTFLSEDNVDVVDGVKVQASAANAMRAESQFHANQSYRVKSYGGASFIEITNENGIPVSDRERTINGIEPDYIARARQNLREVYGWGNKTKEEQDAIDDNITRGLLDGMQHARQSNIQMLPQPKIYSNSGGRRGGGSSYIPSDIDNVDFTQVTRRVDNRESMLKVNDAIRKGNPTLASEFRHNAVPIEEAEAMGMDMSNCIVLNKNYEKTNHKFFRGKYVIPNDPRYKFILTEGDNKNQVVDAVQVFTGRYGNPTGEFASAGIQKPLLIKALFGGEQGMLQYRMQRNLNKQIAEQQNNISMSLNIPRRESGDQNEEFRQRIAFDKTVNEFIEIVKFNPDVNKAMFEYYASPVKSGYAKVYSMDGKEMSISKFNNMFANDRADIVLGACGGSPAFSINGNIYTISADSYYQDYTSLGAELERALEEYKDLYNNGYGYKDMWNKHPYSTIYTDPNSVYTDKVKSILNNRVKQVLNVNKSVKSSKERYEDTEWYEN